MGDTARVVFVSQHYPPDKGGNASRVHDLATHLAGGNWEVTVLAPPPSYPPGEFERSKTRTETERVEGVTVHRLWSWQPTVEDPGMASRLAYYLVFGLHAMAWLLSNRRGYDVVVTTTPPVSTGAPGLLAAALGKPWVVDVRDLWIDASITLGYLREGSAIERMSRRFQRHVLHTADGVAVTTESLGDSLRERYGESLAGKTFVVPNGVDVSRFRPADTDGDERSPGERQVPDGAAGTDETGKTGDTADTADTGYVDGTDETGTAGEATGSEESTPGWPSAETDGGGPVIIYTGNLGSAQDLESFVHAMVHLSHDSALLRLVGGGDCESKLRRLAAELGVDHAVEFTGVVPREEVPALLNGATLGVAPLKDEPELRYAMPTKLYEYMASGLPAVVTGRGEIERFVESSGGGVHVANDPVRIAEVLDDLLADGGRRRRCAERGREYVEDSYDRKAIARAFGDELARLVGDSPAGRSR